MKLNILRLALLIISCYASVNFEIEKKVILKLHHLKHNYHFNKDSIAFTSQLSND